MVIDEQQKHSDGVLYLLFFLLIAVLGALWYVRHVAAVAPAQRIEKVNSFSTGSINTPISVHFLDIGQGDATYIEFTDGRDMLVDCSKDARVLPALGRSMKAFDRTIDYLVITHPHADHFGGCIDVLKRFTVKHIVYNGLESHSDPLWQLFWQVVQDEGAEITVIDHEQTWNMASSTVHFLYPDRALGALDIHENGVGDLGTKINDTSIVFLLQYGQEKALFTGDMESDLESTLVDRYGILLDVDVLKVGHHGSPGASSQKFLDMVTPAWASISVGKENTYGHPSQRVIKRLERLNTQVFRTDLDGDVILQIFSDAVIQ